MSKQTQNKTYIPAVSAKAKSAEVKQTSESLALAKYRKKRFWTLGVISLATVLVLTLSIIFAVWTPPVPEEISNTAPKATTDAATVRNGNFDYVKGSGLSLQYPYIPANWTVNKSSDIDSVVGIIDTNEENWGRVKRNLNGLGINFSSSTENKLRNTPDYDLTQAGSQYEDDYVDTGRLMMVYNKTTAVANLHSTNFSITSSKYYAISVWVLTDMLEDSDEGAYIWLTTSSSTYSEPEARFEGIKASVWTQYTFYIEASKSTSTTLYLSFGLGHNSSSSYTSSKGIAFFDYAVSTMTSKGDYIVAERDTTSRVTTFKSFAKATTDTVSVPVAADFSNSFGVEPISAEQFEANHADQGKLPFYTSGIADIYYLDNSSSPKDGLHVSFDSHTIEAPSNGKNYRLSFWVKTSDLPQGTGAYAYLVDKTMQGTLNKSIVLGPVNTPKDPDDNTYNGWAEYIFFIRPSNTINYDLQLQIYLGKMNNTGSPVASGKMFVTEVELTEIEPSDYTNATTGSSVQKLDLSTPGSGESISNGTFDNAMGNVGSNYPIAPANWNLYYAGMAKVDGDNQNIAPNPSDSTFYGIMNRSRVSANTKHGLADTDFPVYGGNNVLMLSSTIKTAMGVQSDAFNLSANGYYHISVLVKTLNGAKANVYLISTPTPDDEIENNDLMLSLSSGSGTYYQTETEVDANGYMRYNFFIATGYYSKTVRLELWLGNRDAADESGYSMGTVLFDQASCLSLEKKDFRKFMGTDEGVALVRNEIRDEEDNLTEVELTLRDDTVNNVAGRDLTGVDVEPEADDEEEEEETPITPETPKEPFNWLQIPTLVIALTLMFVIFSFVFRKFSKYRKVKIENPDYQRK